MKNWRVETALWITRHPGVYAEFQRQAQVYKQKGRPFSFNLLRELVRYYFSYSHADEKYKFCNSMSPYVARHLIADDPELEEFIEVRSLKEETNPTDDDIY